MAQNYRKACLKMIWKDHDSRRAISFEYAEAFVQMVLDNLLGRREELQREVEVEEWGDEHDIFETDIENAEMPEANEPLYPVLLAQMYILLCQVYTEVDTNSPLYRLLHGRNVLHTLFLLLHSPDSRERNAVKEVLQTILWMANNQDKDEFVLLFLRDMIGLVQGGLMDVQQNQDQISLRPSNTLITVALDILGICTGTVLQSLIRLTFQNMLLPLFDSKGFHFYVVQYDEAFQVGFRDAIVPNDLEYWARLCKKFIQSLWHSANRTTDQDNNRFALIVDYIFGGFIIPTQLASLFQKTLDHFAKASITQHVTFLTAISCGQFLDLFNETAIFATEEILNTVITKIYATLCQWYLVSVNKTDTEIALFEALELWEKRENLWTVAWKDSTVRTLRKRVGALMRTRNIRIGKKRDSLKSPTLILDAV